MKKHCWDCAYKRTNPGDAHVTCVRAFGKTPTPELSAQGIRGGWCHWPLNYDPIWVGKCKGYAKKEDPKKVRKNANDPLLSILGILASVGRI